MKVTRRDGVTLIHLARHLWAYANTDCIVVRVASWRYQWDRTERRGFLLNCDTLRRW